MVEIFNFILKILTFEIPIPFSFLNGQIGYISIFSILVLVWMVSLVSYIISKVYK